MKKATTLLKPEEVQMLEFLAKFGVAHDRHILLHLAKLVQVTIGDSEYLEKINPQIDDSAEILKNYAKMIKRLVAADYIVQHKLYANEGAYITLGALGADLLATKAVKGLSLNTLKHDMLVLDLYFDLLDKNPGGLVMSERELRFASGIKVGDKKKVPDLLLTDAENKQIAIEVEISEKSHARLIEIINNYLNDVKLSAAHYFVESKALGNKLLELSGHHPKISVFLLSRDNSSEMQLAYAELQVNEEDRTEKSKSPWSFDLDEYLNNREKYKNPKIIE